VRLTVLRETFSVCRFPHDSPVPIEPEGPLFAFIRSSSESTLVVEDRLVPSGATAVPGWSALQVEGPLDFALTGVLSSLALPLAEAEISIFAISTYDTDYVLVMHDKLAVAIDVLRKAGHEVTWCN
jgi:hypothetical protein